MRDESPSGFRAGVLIPTYDNPATIRAVVSRARAQVDEVLVVDDGSAEPAQRVLRALSSEGLATVHRRLLNGGKGAAVKTGLAAARALGWTHALQVDADGQHELDDLPRFLEVARAHPDALILGAPVFDASAPKARRIGREVTIFWTNFEAGRGVITDPMCGFRVYPIEAALAVRVEGDAMDFDPEIAVKMAWAGTPVINVPTRVRYVSRDEGGVSHFRLLRDNALISWMHTRLSIERIARGRRR